MQKKDDYIKCQTIQKCENTHKQKIYVCVNQKNHENCTLCLYIIDLKQSWWSRLEMMGMDYGQILSPV